jgi:hypothetical protein
MTKTTYDTILSQIPSHIIENYPRFYEFLAAYYEWMMQDGNPQERITNHMDYLNFEKSLDQYVNMMKKEYLSDVPEEVLVDKEMFIKWSKKFNLSRGSHASFKFLFKILFGEQTTSIYLPKENILKTSDGVWVSGESLIYVTHSSDNLEQFQFQTIEQERPIYGDITEKSTALVQRVRTRYVGRYVVTELSVANINGEFKQDYPIKTVAGAEEWLINVGNSVSVNQRGSGHFNGERLFIDNFTDYAVNRNSEQDFLFDTRVTSFFNSTDLQLFVNSSQVTDFEFDGRFISSSAISKNDDVEVILPSYQGYIVVDEINQSQEITSVDLLDLPIGTGSSFSVISESDPTLEADMHIGYTKTVKGYYQGTKGQLSSNMYLQDSYFYQNYSYAIRTQQDFTAYADIVKRVLHPAGFVLFGQLSFINIIELILTYQDQIDIPPTVITNLHKYGLGGNYNFVNRFKDGASIRLYKQSDFDSLDQDYLNGEAGYDLESKYLADLISSYDLAPIKGWMSKFNWADYYLYVPQDYSDEDESGDLYFETGYVSTRTS